MFRSRPFREEQALGDRLRREAAACRPVFSETLHQRLCRAVRRCEAGKPDAAPVSQSSKLPRYWIAAAMAAAGVLAAAVIAWQMISDERNLGQVVGPSPASPGAPVRAPSVSGPAPPAADAPADLEMVSDLADRAAEEIVGLVKSTVTEGHWAYLNQNARLAVEAVTDCVPLEAVASLAFAEAGRESGQIGQDYSPDP